MNKLRRPDREPDYIYESTIDFWFEEMITNNTTFPDAIYQIKWNGIEI
jgi:hypothetical protein